METRRGGEHVRGREHERGRGPVLVHRQEANHRVADADPRDALAELGDRSGDVDPGRVREAHGELLLQIAGADRGVDRVERGRRDLDERLARCGVRLCGVFVAHDLRIAIRVVAHCFHGMSSLVGPSVDAAVE